MDDNAQNFEEFIDQVLEPNSRVYASPRIGDDKMHSLIYNENTSKVVFSQTEIVGLEKYFEGNKKVDVVPYTVKDHALYLNSTGASVDSEFVALPGRRSSGRSGGVKVNQNSIKDIAKDWAEISDRLVKDREGSTHYLDTLWLDDRSPRDPNLSLDQIHEAEEKALRRHFKNIANVEGDDYSLLRATR